MMASTAISNHPVTNSNFDRSKRKKKKKSQAPSKENQNQGHAKWKTEAQQQIYSSKLIQALSQVRLSPSSPSAPRQGRAVREAADRALAFAAKGKTRWSRAILTSRIKLKFRKQHKRHRVVAASTTSTVTGTSRSKKPRVSVLRLKGKSLPAVQRKAYKQPEYIWHPCALFKPLPRLTFSQCPE
ncbi:hypothetical protein GH714_007629 [Hevea brasiliensis]|uniref:IBH1-like N-terminal domain-containing protein n=1 Tax=Hevea brasiliensis TaxID=3981 RepID=A0A6A6ME93_HEVBR|nr:hypothetical protein GH714_007629 [Hevea brasiliensis]